MTQSSSPYLKDPNRLGDVIAAIQVMATYKFYKLPFDTWADRISANSSRGEYWKKIFEEHPEFFRLDGEQQKASLVWRRQYPKRFHVDQERVLTREECEGLAVTDKERVSRVRLTSGDIKALIDIAIGLHSKALEAQRDKRWWVPLGSAVGALIGAIIGALLKSK
jgi:hypothetical protein